MRFFVFFLFLLFSLPSYGVSFEEFLNRLSKVKTAVIEFKQLTKLPVAGDEVSLYEGVIYYKRPLKFRWEYRKGSRIFIVSNGTYLETVFPEDGDCEIYKVDENSLLPLVGLLEDPKKFLKRYQVAVKEGEVLFVSKDKDSYFRKLFLIFDGSFSLKNLRKVILYQSDGTKEVFVIAGFKVNERLKDSLFVLPDCQS